MNIFKKIIRIMFFVSLLIIILQIYVSATEVGDLNGDNTVDTVDVKLFSQYFAGWRMEENAIRWDAADVNGDKEITRADAMTLARIVAKWEGYGFTVPSGEIEITVADPLKYEFYYETDEYGENKYTFTANDLPDGELYNFYVIKLQKDMSVQNILLRSPQNITSDDYVVNTETVLYINQVMSNSDGTVIIKDFKPMYEADSVIMLSGNGEQKVVGTIHIKN